MLGKLREKNVTHVYVVGLALDVCVAFTALHAAVLYNRPAILAQLVSDDRVDTSLKNNIYDTPLKLAIRSGRDECAKILREHGAPEE